MIKNQRIIAVIPARGGSKSVPYKNLFPLAGKPLIAWTIELAKSIQEIDRVIVSTDDERISETALAHGAEVYKRPAPLAADNSLVIDALKDLIGRLRIERETAQCMLLLEPTSPLRAAKDITDVLYLMIEGGYDSAATFMPAKLNPHRAWKIQNSEPKVFVEGAVPWKPRQELPEAFQLNGAVYGFSADGLMQNKSVSLLFGKQAAVVMPTERSVDIDDEFDFKFVESLMAREKK